MLRGCTNWNSVAAKPDRIFDSREAASTALADHIADVLKTAITKRGNGSLVVSGGTSPLQTFHTLRQKVLSWRDVTIVPSDERLVPVDHADSNEGMIRRELMQGEATAAQLLSLVGEGVPGIERLAKLNSQLGNIHRPLDIVVLGMGDDGHTASLFPNSPDIGNALNSSDDCVVQQPPHLDIARLSLTPAFLLDASEIILLFFGDEKRAIYDRAAEGGDSRELPVRFLLEQKLVPVTMFWAP